MFDIGVLPNEVKKGKIQESLRKTMIFYDAEELSEPITKTFRVGQLHSLKQSKSTTGGTFEKNRKIYQRVQTNFEEIQHLGPLF